MKDVSKGRSYNERCYSYIDFQIIEGKKKKKGVAANKPNE